MDDLGQRIFDTSGQTTDQFKKLGQKISQIVRQDGQYLNPLLASFTARVITLENTGKYPVEPPNMCSSLPAVVEDELIQQTIQRCLSQNHVLSETIKMQLTFESCYAYEQQRVRKMQDEEDKRNSQMIDNIIQLGNNQTTSQQVATLYRMQFKQLLNTSTVPEAQRDRKVESEIAVALESVFPQSNLNSFVLCTNEQKQQQILNMINVVLGIRLFNRVIKHGGAGLVDIPVMCSAETDHLYERLEVESQEIGDVCFTLSDQCQQEIQRPGTLSCDYKILLNELINRRQYVLFLHQLQHEVQDAAEQIRNLTLSLDSEIAKVKSVVGVKSAVPREQVFVTFNTAACAWRALQKEREKNTIRLEIQGQLQRFRASFDATDVQADLPKLKFLTRDKLANQPSNVTYTPTGDVDISHFVEVYIEGDSNMNANSNRPQRLQRETTVNFMALPLETQGYCPYTIVMRTGLLLPGDPTLGIIRYHGKHYAFSSYNAMCTFCQDPDKFLDGIIAIARRIPCLIHLLGLQPYIPQSDITDYIVLDNSTTFVSSNGKLMLDAQTQQSNERVNTDELTSKYEWNEWKLREQILKYTNITNMKTTSTQTRLSHFKRDSSTQTTIKQCLEDGTMPGTGTQTMIDKGTNVERTIKYEYGIRGKPTSTFRTIQITLPETVRDGTNGDLTELAAKIVSRPIVREFQ